MHNKFTVNGKEYTYTATITSANGLLCKSVALNCNSLHSNQTDLHDKAIVLQLVLRFFRLCAEKGTKKVKMVKFRKTDSKEKKWRKSQKRRLV